MSVRDDIMDEILDAVRTLYSSNDYDVQLASEPIPYRENHLTMPKNQTPTIMLADQGDDTVLVQSPTETMYSVSVALFGFSRRDTWEATKADLNAIIASVEQLIDSEPDLGSAILDWQYVEGLGHFFTDQKLNNYGYTTILTTVLYRVTNGTY